MQPIHIQLQLRLSLSYGYARGGARLAQAARNAGFLPGERNESATHTHTHTRMHTDETISEVESARA